MIRGGMVTLAVRNVGEAVRFYIETLGMKLVEERAGSSILDAGDDFLIELRPGTPGAAVPITFFAKVPLAEAIAIYENRGIVFTTDGVFNDPDGNPLRLAAR